LTLFKSKHNINRFTARDKYLMAVATETLSVDQIPEINDIWLHPSASFIVDAASLALCINVRRIPNMMAVGFAGAQNGDESKGQRVYDLAHILALNKTHGVNLRIGGGAGAGHTIYPEGQEEEIVYSMLPCAVDKNWTQISGRGELIRVDTIIKEIQRQQEKGFSVSPGKIMIDGAAKLAWQAHGERDLAEETFRGAKNVGTTKKGVGPAASDYTARQGMHMGELLLPREELRKRVIEEVDLQNRLLEAWRSPTQYDPEEIFTQFLDYAKFLNPYIQNTYPIVTQALKQGNFIGECAQAFSLGRDTGFRGMVTSTDTGFGPLGRRYRTSENYLGWRIGVAKLIPTFVGRHMNYSPLPEHTADLLYGRTAQRGKPEAGAVSGRKRIYYWLSIPELRAAIETYDLNALVFAKMDVADVLPEIEFGMEYVFSDGSRTTDYDPDDERMYNPETRMNTIRMPGWNSSIAGLNNYHDAPHNLRAIVQTIEQLTDTPVIALGTGPHFGECIYAENSPFVVSSK
jgi:adenylosuccinate synthase